ncbi:Vesicle transport v-SNARE 13 [Vitis vinifera]|uniref:Vesicle transport v-SNARE 13 n=1 Tax=Vitis vinifera TaxID=29760 RepID=A0A438I155_VITVI|nr:Vesicle transport v-SNARE 13 [Vitis vinifera]
MWVRRNEVKETKWMRLAFKAPKSSKLPTLSQVGRCCRTHDASGRDAECSGLCVLMMCREEEFPTLVSLRLFFSLTKFIKQVVPMRTGPGAPILEFLLPDRSIHNLPNTTFLRRTSGGFHPCSDHIPVGERFRSNMSQVFEGYERQYCELSANLSRKCTAASLLNGGVENLPNGFYKYLNFQIVLNFQKNHDHNYHRREECHLEMEYKSIPQDFLSKTASSRLTFVFPYFEMASSPNFEQKKQKVSEIKAGLDDADALIRKMDLEARSLQPSVKAMLLAKLREYKTDLNNVKNEVKRITSANTNQAARDNLLESGMADTMTFFPDKNLEVIS